MIHRTKDSWQFSTFRIVIFVVAGLFSLTANIFAGDRPTTVRWDFGTEETTPLQSFGGVHRDVPGPRPPEYPDFETGNTAVKLDGNGARLSFADPGAQSPFDFTNWDSITLEAWVLVSELHPGENAYVIGKGRTGSSGFAADNQNWALRIRETQGKAGVSFLFATVPASGATKSENHWHRWNTNSGFATGKDWHHIAVAYRFGDSKSVRCWIDGKQQPGDWDMGGPTDEPPIVDDDAIWIGSSRGGAAANSFRGSLDSIAVHRQLLDDAVMKNRYRRLGGETVAKLAPESMPDLGPLDPGHVAVWLHEGFPAHTRWLNEGESIAPATMTISIDQFLMKRLPQRYDAWGIRENWSAPVLMRMAADVRLKPGKHRFLMRVRGLSRLWIDGNLVARSQPHVASSVDNEPITPVAKPPLPGLRIAEHRHQDIFGEAVIGDDGKCRLVMETLVGAKTARVDTGEILVAVQSDDEKTYLLVSPAGASLSPIPLTDRDVTSALAKQEILMTSIDDKARHLAASSQDHFWNARHDAARAWAKLHSPSTIPAASLHPIDAFLKTAIDRAVAESANAPTDEAKHFHEEVLPILRDQCFRCHGDKESGGLRLNSRTAALKAGESERFAVVPGRVEESELIRRIRSTDADERMPPGAKSLSPKQIDELELWVKSGALWPAVPLDAADITVPPVVNDAAFLRRVYLDTVGVPATEIEARQFLQDPSPDKRNRLIDHLLPDDRWADHWVSYWQDVLAENPTMLNPSLNTTGPFRWFLYEALRDNKPFDRLVTELIMLRGSLHEGGSAGFGIAADNDAPFAAKGQIVANAFLGIELQCARCHDSPFHSTKQSDLYSLAAMFERKPVSVPATSRVPAAFFEKKARESLIKVTLKPREPIEARWPFVEVTGSADDTSLNELMQQPTDQRERLAALITSPRNARFPRVIVNRIWRRLMGAGFVEPAHDWEGRSPCHPELLDWLAREFISHDYDLKHLAKLILTSETYQREATGNNLTASAERRLFVAPDRRRLSAEQIVDSMYAAAGQSMSVEELTFDPDARRPTGNRISLGIPRRAWMFANLNNERDRPALSLPRSQAVVDVMEAFGWSGARQNPRTDRETSPNVLQPGVLANSTFSVCLTRAANASGLAEIAVTSTSPEQLVDSLFLRFLNRLPTDAERSLAVKPLSVSFEYRLVPANEVCTPTADEPLPRVTWSNHLLPESTTIAMELERRARNGPAVDPRLRTDWREVFEDVVWNIVNLREFVWIP